MKSFKDILEIIKINGGVVILITKSDKEYFSFAVINELKNEYKIYYNYKSTKTNN